MVEIAQVARSFYDRSDCPKMKVGIGVHLI